MVLVVILTEQLKRNGQLAVTRQARYYNTRGSLFPSWLISVVAILPASVGNPRARANNSVVLRTRQLRKLRLLSADFLNYIGLFVCLYRSNGTCYRADSAQHNNGAFFQSLDCVRICAGNYCCPSCFVFARKYCDRRFIYAALESKIHATQLVLQIPQKICFETDTKQLQFYYIST